MNLGWLTDIHLDFVDAAGRARFAAELAATPVDAWLIAGDIATAPTLVDHLRHLADAAGAPVWFVLGNHDFYRGSLAGVARAVSELVAGDGRLLWLTHAPPQRPARGIAVVGDDGWADARLGNALATPVLLNDFVLIEELTGHSRPELVRTLNALGDAAAARLAPKLAEAARDAREVVVITHVPPFREATWHEGAHSDDDHLPWFSCRASGEVLLAAAAAHPDVRFRVLCGHSHGAGECRPAPNLEVRTGGAAYGAPVVQGVLRS
jgi:3',5'-cyclic AMP phosphodiesterase CpdA